MATLLLLPLLGRVPPSDDAADIDDYVYQIVFSDGSTEWELLAECIDPKKLNVS